MERRLVVFLFAVLLAIAPQVRATDPTVPDLLARQRVISAGIDSGAAPYANMPESVRSSLQADQRRLATLLEGKESLSQLAPSHRNQVLALVSGIEAAISDSQGQRMSCTQEARTGSNVVTRVCRTAAQLHNDQQAGEKLLGNERSRIKCNERNGCM